MATDSILGLFTDPYQYMQQQNQAQNRAATEFAQLTPMQQAQFGIYKGAGQLGGGFAGAMGVQDPVLQRQSQRQQLLKGLDWNDPTALANASRAALEMNDVQASREFSAAAERLKATQLEAEVKKSQIARNLRERPANMSELSKLQAEREDLIAQFGENDPRVKEINALIAKKTTVGKTIGQEIGEGLGQGLGLIGKALSAGLKKEGEETGQFAAKDFNALGSAVAAGTASKRNIQTMENALSNSFTGKFADTKTNIISSLKGLGLDVNKDLLEATSNTELVNAMGTRYVFPLVKNFPGSLAAKELAVLQETSPNSLQQPATIARLVGLLKTDIAENEYTYNQAKKYKEAKNSTIGFNPADSKIEFQQKYNQLKDLVAAARKKNSVTEAEKQRIEALKRELGV
jgi:hypothetical protein